MIEKVNPSHPDKIADRIAGALVDLAYKKLDNPKIAVEVLIGHGKCHIILETNVIISLEETKSIVNRIAGNIEVDLLLVEQDINLANNQKDKIRCGDNGIFKGIPLSNNEKEISKIARLIYDKYPYDGKYILSDDKLIVCQSNSKKSDLEELLHGIRDNIIINPLGDWTGGINVDSGATNRKLGSDMAKSVTGGGIHGKDLSKADVSVNIYAFKRAQETNKEVNLYCAIGDEYIDGLPYEEIISEARNYIESIGGFEELAKWGLF